MIALVALACICLAAALILCITIAQNAAPPPDSSMAAAISTFVFDSLRGGGSRSDMIWIARDSTTWSALAAVAAARGIHLLPPGSETVTCPGSTDAAHLPLPGISGYQVSLRTRSDSARVILSASLSCMFAYRGRPELRGFQEGRAWEIARTERGWRIARLIHIWIT